MQTDVWNILDTCAFLSQTHPDGKIATANGIEDEIVNRQSKQYYSNLKSKGLKIVEPQNDSIEYVEKVAQRTGDLDVLSSIDLKILALGHEFEGIIISDDFSIQNAALHMKLEVISCSGNEIKELRVWKYKCSACNRISKDKKESCEVCGSEDIFRIKAK
tara:strand:- start:180 stop:659 length:480 start_codon:yes stop_codon:yes gene_type:complete